MSDSDGRKTLGLGGSRPSNVKQSFSHGRTKNVVVETKRKRVVVPKPGAANKAGAVAPLGVSSPSKRPAGISDAQMQRLLRQGYISVFSEKDCCAKDLLPDLKAVHHPCGNKDRIVGGIAACDPRHGNATLTLGEPQQTGL